MHLNLIASPSGGADRGSDRLLLRLAKAPDGIDEFSGVLDALLPGWSLSLMTDEELEIQSREDEATFGGARLAAWENTIRVDSSEAPSDLEGLVQLLAHSEDFGELLETPESTLQEVLGKTQKLLQVFKPKLIEKLVLNTHKIGAITRVDRAYKTKVPEDDAHSIAATPEAVEASSDEGARFIALPASVRNESRSSLKGYGWWGVLPEEPKVEFFGRTQKDVRFLMRIWRASKAELVELKEKTDEEG